MFIQLINQELVYFIFLRYMEILLMNECELKGINKKLFSKIYINFYITNIMVSKSLYGSFLELFGILLCIPCINLSKYSQNYRFLLKSDFNRRKYCNSNFFRLLFSIDLLWFEGLETFKNMFL